MEEDGTEDEISTTQTIDIEDQNPQSKAKKKYVCNYCKTSYTFGHIMKMHMITCSQSVKPMKKYQCKYCNYRNEDLQRVKTHLALHSKDKKFVCEVCKKAFAVETSLTAHVKYMHSEAREEEFQCDQCDFKTIHKFNMIRHKEVHSDVRQFKCPECNKVYKHKRNINAHMYKHNNKEKPIPCPDPDCNKRFASQSHCTHHHNTVHLKIKKFKCDDCGYATINKALLRTHTYTHLVDQPFKCNLCSYQCVKNAYLQNHIKKKHPKDSSE